MIPEEERWNGCDSSLPLSGFWSSPLEQLPASKVRVASMLLYLTQVLN